MDLECDLSMAIQPQKLDFDQAHQCHVTLATEGILVCLQCGKFVQGLHENSPCQVHSLHTQHPLYMSLEDGRVWVMPLQEQLSGDLVDDKIRGGKALLEAIRRDLFPSLDLIEEAMSKKNDLILEDASGKSFKQGFLGINAPTRIRPILALLAHIPAIRDHFLSKAKDGEKTKFASPMVVFMKAMWNPCRLRASLTPPQPLLQTPTGIKDVSMLFIHFLHTEKLLPAHLKSLFRGNLRATPVEAAAGRSLGLLPFYMLAIDIPPTPLFREYGGRGGIVPQYSLLNLLLEKYVTGTSASFLSSKKSSIASDAVNLSIQPPMPPYLVISLRGRCDNKQQRNPSVINYDEWMSLDGGLTQYRLHACVALRKQDSPDDTNQDLLTYCRENSQNVNNGGTWWCWDSSNAVPARIPSVELVRMSDCVMLIWQRQQ